MICKNLYARGLGDKILNTSIFWTKEPSVESKVPDGFFPGMMMASGLRLGYGITDKTDIELELSTAMLTRIGLELRYQWLGESIYKTKQKDWNSTIQLKFIQGIDFFKSATKSSSRPGPPIQNLVAISGFSLSNSFGYMIQDWLAVYGGGQAIYILAKLTGQRQRSGFLGYGPFIGVQLKKSNFNWSLESSLTRLPFYEQKNKYYCWVPGIATSFNFLFQL